jgi:hypothetical protein
MNRWGVGSALILSILAAEVPGRVAVHARFDVDACSLQGTYKAELKFGFLTIPLREGPLTATYNQDTLTARVGSDTINVISTDALAQARRFVGHTVAMTFSYRNKSMSGQLYSDEHRVGAFSAQHTKDAFVSTITYDPGESHRIVGRFIKPPNPDNLLQ